jgi:hypothetical protein
MNNPQSNHDQSSNSADKDLLIITFIGGFAANVGTVVLVGLALTLVHLTRHFLHQQSLVWILIVVIPILLAIVPAVTVYILSKSARRTEEGSVVISVSRKTKIVMLLIICPMILLEILLLIGLAAGVK